MRHMQRHLGAADLPVDVAYIAGQDPDKLNMLRDKLRSTSGNAYLVSHPIAEGPAHVLYVRAHPDASAAEQRRVQTLIKNELRFEDNIPLFDSVTYLEIEEPSRLMWWLLGGAGLASIGLGFYFWKRRK